MIANQTESYGKCGWNGEADEGVAMTGFVVTDVILL